MHKTISYKSYQKSPYRSIKHSTYFDIYDELFAPYRDKNITFVEIGILNGGSLFMWRDFFGPKARIIGIDLNPNAKKWEEEGFEIHIGSQSDENFWNNFNNSVGSIDIVLDDGGHSYEQQIITTEMLLDQVNDGGLIVVEDTHTSYLSGFGSRKYSFINYTKNFIDKINYRFGNFSHMNSDGRVWSIQFFESIVAFKINKVASNLLSEETHNNGISESAADFRYYDNKLISKILKINSSISYLKAIPGTRFILKLLINFLSKSTNKVKKYFK